MSEKIGGAKGTELDDEFVEMEKVRLTSVLLTSFELKSVTEAVKLLAVQLVY